MQVGMLRYMLVGLGSILMEQEQLILEQVGMYQVLLITELVIILLILLLLWQMLIIRQVLLVVQVHFQEVVMVLWLHLMLHLQFQAYD